MKSKTLLTPEEQMVMTKLSEAWNAFVKLKSVHPDEQNEMRCAIHQAQHLIMARPQAKLYYKEVMGTEWSEPDVD